MITHVHRAARGIGRLHTCPNDCLLGEETTSEIRCPGEGSRSFVRTRWQAFVAWVRARPVGLESPLRAKMAADNFSVTLNLQYTPPGSPANSGVAAFPVAGTYQAGQSGTVDVPTTASVGDIISIPFGSVAAAKLVVLRNNLSAEVGVRLNGAVANNFNIPPGGEFIYAVPTAPGAVPLSQMDIVLTAVPTVKERIIYLTLGD